MFLFIVIIISDVTANTKGSDGRPLSMLGRDEDEEEEEVVVGDTEGVDEEKEDAGEEEEGMVMDIQPRTAALLIGKGMVLLV